MQPPNAAASRAHPCHERNSGRSAAAGGFRELPLWQGLPASQSSSVFPRKSFLNVGGSACGAGTTLSRLPCAHGWSFGTASHGPQSTSQLEALGWTLSQLLPPDNLMKSCYFCVCSVHNNLLWSCSAASEMLLSM